MSRKPTLLICDIDNTLYDWVSFFVPAISALIDQASEILAVDRAQVLRELQQVHRNQGSIERAFSLLSIPSVSARYGADNFATAKAELDPAFKAFNSVRKAQLRLYPGVADTLSSLLAQGVTVVAYTESRLINVYDRLSRLGLVDTFKYIYCHERDAHPVGLPTRDDWLHTIDAMPFRELPSHERKPSPKVIREICDAEGLPASSAAYIGDSLAKDVLMANRAGILAVWAKYGTRYDPEFYEVLISLSHWTDEDIERERKLAKFASEAKPDLIAETSFSEVLGIFQLS